MDQLCNHQGDYQELTLADHGIYMAASLLGRPCESRCVGELKDKPL